MSIDYMTSTISNVDQSIKRTHCRLPKKLTILNSSSFILEIVRTPSFKNRIWHYIRNLLVIYDEKPIL